MDNCLLLCYCIACIGQVHSILAVGAEYPIYQVYIEYENEQLKTTVTSQKLIIPIMSIYFGENNQYVMNLTYLGNGVTEQ